MFRKLVANISFSPSLIGELAQYSQDLEKKQRLQLLGTGLLTLLLCLLFIITLSPTESSNQASLRDILYGGVANKDDLLVKFDNNSAHIQDIYSALGITRSDIVAAQETISYTPPQGAFITTSTDSPLISSDSSYLLPYAADRDVLITPYSTQESALTHHAFVGHSTGGDFAIIAASGNVVISRMPQNSIAAKCHTVSASNQHEQATCAKDLSFTTTIRTSSSKDIARPSDKITYTILVKNTSHSPLEFSFSNNVSDLLEYATIVDQGDARFDEATHSLQWRNTIIPAGETYEYTFFAHIKPHTPSTPQGASNYLSYDCHITNGVGTITTIKVSCPLQRQLPHLFNLLPGVNIYIVIITTGLLTLLNLYLLLRTRQQREEIRLIRYDINSGDL